MRLIVSPWATDFESFVRSIRKSAVIVAPFITREPLERFASFLDHSGEPRIELLTNLATTSLLEGTLDIAALAAFCRSVRHLTVRHPPGLHAKAYIADEHTAIITSGNLTLGSLQANYEYGVQIDERPVVRRIADDLRQYGALGSAVSLADLERLSEISRILREKHSETLASARLSMLSIRQEFEKDLQVARDTLLELRARPGESSNSIFARTILYLLRDSPLTTDQIHQMIESIHPDLCDNSIERIINGVRF